MIRRLLKDFYIKSTLKKDFAQKIIKKYNFSKKAQTIIAFVLFMFLNIIYCLLFFNTAFNTIKDANQIYIFYVIALTISFFFQNIYINSIINDKELKYYLSLPIKKSDFFNYKIIVLLINLIAPILVYAIYYLLIFRKFPNQKDIMVNFSYLFLNMIVDLLFLLIIFFFLRIVITIFENKNVSLYVILSIFTILLSALLVVSGFSLNFIKPTNNFYKYMYDIFNYLTINLVYKLENNALVLSFIINAVIKLSIFVILYFVSKKLFIKNIYYMYNTDQKSIYKKSFKNKDKLKIKSYRKVLINSEFKKFSSLQGFILNYVFVLITYIFINMIFAFTIKNEIKKQDNPMFVLLLFLSFFAFTYSMLSNLYRERPFSYYDREYYTLLISQGISINDIIRSKVDFVKLKLVPYQIIAIIGTLTSLFINNIDKYSIVLHLNFIVLIFLITLYLPYLVLHLDLINLKFSTTNYQELYKGIKYPLIKMLYDLVHTVLFIGVKILIVFLAMLINNEAGKISVIILSSLTDIIFAVILHKYFKNKIIKKFNQIKNV